MPPDTPRQSRQLVLVGGGHSHVAVLKSFGLQPVPEARLVLISPEWDTPYSGMLPALIAGHYLRDQTQVDLFRLSRFANAEFYRDRVVGLDLTAKKLQLAERPAVHFDLLSIDIGSTPSRAAIPGADEFAIPVKPIDRLLHCLEQIEARCFDSTGRPFRIVTVGGGAAGVEVTLSIQHRLERLRQSHHSNGAPPEYTIITASPRLLENHNRRVADRFEHILRERNVQVLTGNPVVEVTADAVVCRDSKSIPHDALLWATHASAPEWPRHAGLTVDKAGFIAVNSRLQSTSHEFVYAAGDVAAMVQAPRPKSGVFAVRQGPPLARNLRLSLMGFAARPYRPQRSFLSLISTGDRQAVASKGPFAWGGPMIWRWKQRIDRRWMRQYEQLPTKSTDTTEMDFTARMKRNLRTVDSPGATNELTSGTFGFGRKLGAVVLHEALKQLKLPAHPSIVVGLNAPDNAAVWTPAPGQVVVQSVSLLRAPLNDPWLSGRIAANHALGNLYAMGARPVTAHATITLEPAADSILVEELSHLLAGVSAQLALVGATLVGGHSAEGRERTLGLSVSGTAISNQLFRRSGLLPGDQLVITGPLGVGACLAAQADLRLKAPGLRELLDQLLLPKSPAAEIFAQTGAIACTDVGGFGLLGHLREMLGAAEVHVELLPASVPRFGPAMDFLVNRKNLTAAPVNAAYLNLMSSEKLDLQSPEIRLMLDPQIAGPLLAAIPREFVSSALDQLHQAGFPCASVIGTVREGARTRPFII